MLVVLFPFDYVYTFYCLHSQHQVHLFDDIASVVHNNSNSFTLYVYTIVTYQELERAANMPLGYNFVPALSTVKQIDKIHVRL